jgi:hypothetical protein
MQHISEQAHPFEPDLAYLDADSEESSEEEDGIVAGASEYLFVHNITSPVASTVHLRQTAVVHYVKCRHSWS